MAEQEAQLTVTKVRKLVTAKGVSEGGGGIATKPAKARPKKGPRPKHVPQRTCIACRTTDGKRTLIRLVRTPEGSVEIDETGKKAGRGAYLCKQKDCWDKGLSKKLLDNALKVTIDPDTRTRLKAYGDTLPERSADEVEQVN